MADLPLPLASDHPWLAPGACPTFFPQPEAQLPPVGTDWRRPPPPTPEEVLADAERQLDPHGTARLDAFIDSLTDPPPPGHPG